MNSQSEGLKMNWELRADARAQLKDNWVIAIMACIIFGLISGTLGAIPIVGWAFVGVMTLGLCRFFVNLSSGTDARLENLFDGFNLFSKAAILQLLIIVFTFLWSLLFIIPGIIAAISYSMSFYILNDNPEMTASEALNHSKNLMRGYKGKLFMLYLSFFGWALLAALTFGIGSFWLIPYINTSVANFYKNLKASTGYNFN